MSNLFSSFDPIVNIIALKFSLSWSSIFIIILVFPASYWSTYSQYVIFFNVLIKYIENELVSIFGKFNMGASTIIFISTFFFIIIINFMGLFPYIFTNTSHIVFTLSIALPVWLGPILWSMYYQYNNIFAHLVPRGTPTILIPVIVIIETVSNVIRPTTLSIRLAANMIAGHLLLTLLGSQGPMSNYFSLLLIIIILILLVILEMAVACIQSYVFTILSSLYLNELITLSFNKYMVN